MTHPHEHGDEDLSQDARRHEEDLRHHPRDARHDMAREAEVVDDADA